MTAERLDKVTRSVGLAATILIFALMVSGGIVRANEATGACPDWPTCFGQWTAPTVKPAALDYTHRAITLLAGAVVFAASGLALMNRRQSKLSRVMLLTASGLILGQSLLGRYLPGWKAEGEMGGAAIHMLLSLIVQALVLIPVVLAYYPAEKVLLHRLRFRSSYAKLTLVTVGLLLLLLTSGTVVSSLKADQACAAWPLCDGLSIPDSLNGWISLFHRGVVAASGVLVTLMTWQAWRTQRTQTVVIVSATTTGVLFWSLALLGAKMVGEIPAYLLGIHQATATAIWMAAVVLAVTAEMAGRTNEQESLEAAEIKTRKGLIRDLLMLTKPIVVVLLLVTTLAGMVIGAKAWPMFWTAFWTLVGGFMAAGGSGAINQYIDRYDDMKMQRTQKRPIPAGRLTPGEGLAFGVGMALGSFFLMTALVNFLAAMLSLAGILYYVLLYSLLLKKTTVQNIVIGGGAGAIPPLVGWAAATGSLNVPAMFLFAIVFMWTPPHFWALALVRRNDYARAGVPMLPVVRGEKETRWQIMIYTLELVGLTLFLPLFDLGGAIYLIGAVILGGWLLMAAFKVWKQGGNKTAWKMYRYSSMYLAFLFMVLMVDRLMIR